jgi:ferric-dicitrate binding protein FerR (iron transport regulator)
VKVVTRAASGKSVHFVERMGSIDPSLVASWRWGKLNFYGQPLAEAVVDVNRHSAQLKLEAIGSASSIPVYGVFDVGDVRGFASAIQDRIATDAAVTGTVRLIEGPAPQ